MYYAAPWDLIPFIVTFIVTLRSSSAGLLIGIFTHLIIALGKFIMPIGKDFYYFYVIFRCQKLRILNSERLSSHEDRENSHEDVIYLEGAVMFPSGDVSLI